MKQVKISLCGFGRMGKAIYDKIPDFPHLLLTGIKVNNFDLSYPIPQFTDTAFFENSDLVMDFSNTEVIMEHLQGCLRYKKPLLIGTTGLCAETIDALHKASNTIPILWAPNTSFGVALLTSFVKKAASLLDESYDIEITEAHHRDKKDAPSGTSLMLGKYAAMGRQCDFDAHKTYPHHHKRQKGDIGFSVSRGGHILGEHTVNFIGDDDVITLSHKGLSRHLYAKGALKLAEKLIQKKPGFYDIKEMWNLLD